MFSKNLIDKVDLFLQSIFQSLNSPPLIFTQEIYEPVFEIVQTLQQVYTFKSDMGADPNLDKYLKHIGAVIYNESLKVLIRVISESLERREKLPFFFHKKELIAKDMDISSKLYIQGQQFNIKLEMSAYTLLKSLRSYSQYHVKANRCDSFFRDLFAMLGKLIKSCVTETKRAYLAKFHLCSVIHLATVGFSNDFKWSKSMITAEMEVLRDLIADGGQPVIGQALSLVDIALSHLGEYQKQATSSNNSSSGQHARLEQQLLIELNNFHARATADENYGQLYLLIHVLEMLAQGIYRLINNNVKCLRDNSLDLFTHLCSVYSSTSQTIFKISAEHSLHRECSHWPRVYFCAWERVLENLFKAKDNTWQTGLNVDRCEETVLGHRDFLVWISTTGLLSQDELEKEYLSLDSQLSRFCSAIFTKEDQENYHIRLLRLWLETCIALLTSARTRTLLVS